MLKTADNQTDILFVLNNLRNEDLEEILALYGHNWLNKMLASLQDKKFYILYGFSPYKTLIPIAMGGFWELFDDDKSIAAVWLLTTKFININKSLFWREVSSQIYEKSKKYKIMFNYIYKSNNEAKKWLKKLGFKFDNPHPENMKLKDGFEFFYKNRKGEK